MERLVERLKPSNFFVIEDAAQALGRRKMGKLAGTWATFGCLIYLLRTCGRLGEAGNVF